MVLSPVVRRLRRFECQSVDDSCRNFTYTFLQNRSPDIVIIYTTFLQWYKEKLVAVVVARLVYDCKDPGSMLA